MDISDKKEIHPRTMNDIREIVGAGGHEIADCSSADAVPNYKCARYAECDSDGIIKFDYVNLVSGTIYTYVGNVYAGDVISYLNIVKVYRYYKEATPCTAQVMNASGDLVNGLRLVY